MSFARAILRADRAQRGRLGTFFRCQKRLLTKTIETVDRSSSRSSRPSSPSSKSPHNTAQEERYPDPYEAWQPPGQPNPLPKTPEAVGMEEFAAFERKLAESAAQSLSAAEPRHGVDAVSDRAFSRNISREQVALEEFAALERKLSTVRRAETVGLRKASPSSLSRPKEPQEGECCGNGCQNCVWIDYWDELQTWNEAERRRERGETPPP